jgi:hypothetical protein
VRHADFVHLVRLSEHASAEDSAAYRRSVAVFAGLGYAWVLGCLLLAAGTLAWIVDAALHGPFRAIYVIGFGVAGGLLWSSARALWFRFRAAGGDPPAAARRPGAVRGPRADPAQGEGAADPRGPPRRRTQCQHRPASALGHAGRRAQPPTRSACRC